MSKKTIVFYTSTEEAEIKRLFSLPPSKERRKQIKTYAESIGRNYTGVYAKAHGEKWTGGLHLVKPRKYNFKKHKAPVIKTDKQSARTNGSEVRFKFSNFHLDMNTKEIVFTIGK